MNLFLIGWNLARETQENAFLELGRMIHVYPQLDPQTLWQCGGRKSFAASLCHGKEVVSSRRYVWQERGVTTLYDGVLVDRTRCFAAHDAKALHENWDRLPDDLDGQFILAKIDCNSHSESVEITTDPFGIDQVYFYRKGSCWLISNSVGLLKSITRLRAIDPLGISMFLTLGWAGSDRTLCNDIRVMPAGQHWKWTGDNHEPIRHTHFSRSSLIQPYRKRLSKGEVADLAQDMGEACRLMAEAYSPVKCAITGGRDSRLVAALLMKSDISAEYYTSGVETGLDVRIGTEIAHRYGLHHTIYPRSVEKLIDEWDVARERLIRQVDGLVSLWQVSEFIGQRTSVDRIRFSFTGHGGEIAKGANIPSKMFLKNWGTRSFSADEIFNHLKARFIDDYRGLLHSKTTAMVADYLKSFHEQVLDDGFSPLDVPNVFQLYEGCRRWQAAQARKNRCTTDRFTPYVMRRFVSAAFSITPQVRGGLPLHRRLLKHLDPEIFRIPFDKKTWPLENPMINYLFALANKKLRGAARKTKNAGRQKKKSSLDPRLLLFESKCSTIREECLDQSNHVVWDFVNRPIFEKITADPKHFYTHGVPLPKFYDVATVCYYSAVL